jgi:hypothetical protein
MKLDPPLIALTRRKQEIMCDHPAWHCGSNERRQKAMTAWVNEVLDSMILEQMAQDLSGKHALDPADYEQYAIEQAKQGNITPLRHMRPEHSEFLHLQKRKRGQRFWRPRVGHPVEAAVEDVRRIRALWREVFGLQRRGKWNPPSAEDIAAERWGVTPATVANKLKKGEHF